MYKIFKFNYMEKEIQHRTARYKALFIFFFLFWFLCAHSYGQGKSEIKRDTTKGVDFFVNAGMYVGNKKNANYYRGDLWGAESEYAQPDIKYILNYWHYKEEILRLIEENNRGIGENSFRINNCSNMRYDLNFSFGLGVKYRFNKHLSIGVALTQARMTANGFAYLGIKIYQTNSSDELRYPLIGKERRTAFELNATYLFGTKKYVCPFLEAGMYVNSTKVISADIVVENVPFSLFNYGTNHDFTYNQTEISRKRGGVGYGFSAAIGLRISFNKWAAIEPVAQFRLEKIQLAGYNSIAPNYNFMIRLVLGDKVFAKTGK